jgi:hypothetical protein
MVKVSHSDSAPVMSHVESSTINRYESEVKIEHSRDCSTKRNEICNTTPPLDSYGFQTLTCGTMVYSGQESMDAMDHCACNSMKHRSKVWPS